MKCMIIITLLQSENCHTHGMPLALWCATCCTALCRACATPQEHPGHQIKSQTDAKEQLISDVSFRMNFIRWYICRRHVYIRGFACIKEISIAGT